MPLLVVVGIVGFFYSASFGSPGEVGGDARRLRSQRLEQHRCTSSPGRLGLFVAGYASRRYSLALGVLYVVAACWGFALGGGESILGLLPVDTADNLLHLALGALGIAAALATPARETPRGRYGLTRPARERKPPFAC